MLIPAKMLEGLGSAYWGSGDDGDVTITSTTVLTRNMQYNNLTINNGISFTSAGYLIQVKGTLTNNGNINHNGGSATGVPASAGTNGFYPGTCAGASVIYGWTPTSTKWSAVTLPNPSVLLNGSLLSPDGGTTWRWYGGGGGGSNGSGGTAGGGGGGGGIVVVFAHTLNNASSITANGGSGGDTLYDLAGDGGGGGCVYVAYNQLVAIGTIVASGGEGGGEGDTGTAGSSGSAGVVYTIKI